MNNARVLSTRPNKPTFTEGETYTINGHRFTLVRINKTTLAFKPDPLPQPNPLNADAHASIRDTVTALTS